jgi:hypothetical protein
MQNHGSWRVVGLLLAIGLVVGALPAAAGADDEVGAPAPAGNVLSPATIRTLVDDLPWGEATARASAGDGVRALAVHTTFVHTDPTGDSNATSDITAVGARYTKASLRLSVTVPQMANSAAADPRWNPSKSQLLWAIDAGGDGTVDKIAIVTASDGGLNAFVVGNTTNPNPLCSGNAVRQSGGRISVQVPSGCVGSPATLSFGVVFNFNGGSAANSDQAPDDDPLAGPIKAAQTSGAVAGVALADNGYLDAFDVNVATPSTIWYSYAGLGKPRGFAGTPDGGHGYVVAGSGRLFGIAFSANNLPLSVYGAKTWANQDMARGVTIRPNGSAGIVVDKFGGLSYFGIGGKRTAPTFVGVPKWPGVDMARGIAVMPDFSGGFTLDAFGGLNWFSIGTAKPAPTIINGPSFPLNDMARGLAILPDGSGGYVIDRNASLHFFSIGTARSAPNAGRGKESWPPDITRGLGLVMGTIPPPVACTPSQPTCCVS